ncbi:MAG: YicC family protein [Planctomycetota bacterium]
MHSMTGFGNATVDGPAGQIRVQIAAVNNKRAQVNVRSGLGNLAIEETVRRRVTAALGRGSISVRIDRGSAGASGFDPEALRSNYLAFKQIAESLGAPTPRLEAVAGFPGGAVDESELAAAVATAVDQALAACEQMRIQEGAHLRHAFERMLAELTACRNTMAELAVGRAEAYRQRLEERLEALLAERAQLEPAQIVRELALYADRVDVTEEIDRLASHAEQFATALASEGAVGKRIEFLLQEMGREVNTVGSKANDAALTAIVVEAKSVLERMREQAANVL